MCACVCVCVCACVRAHVCERTCMCVCVFTSDDYIGGDGHTVHLGLNGAGIFPSMPQLYIPDHDVPSRSLTATQKKKKY